MTEGHLEAFLTHSYSKSYMLCRYKMKFPYRTIRHLQSGLHKNKQEFCYIVCVRKQEKKKTTQPSSDLKVLEIPPGDLPP